MAAAIVQEVAALREEVIESRREVASLTDAFDELTGQLRALLGEKLTTEQLRAILAAKEEAEPAPAKAGKK